MGTRSRRGRRRIALVLGSLTVLALGAIVIVRVGVGTVDPPSIGTSDGRLSPCPDADNCVSSTADDPRHAIEPIVCADADVGRLADVFETERPRVTIAAVSGDYARLVVRSRVFGFVDDLEVLAVGDVVHLRSASRIGRDDLGVNRRRAEDVRMLVTASDACA